MRIIHNDTNSTTSGGTAAPVARTTPPSTIEMPNSTNDHTTIALTWPAIASASLSAGRKNDSAPRLKR